MRFLERHAPGVWDQVQHCREGRPDITPIEDDDRCSVQLAGCKQYPWCPSCNFEAMCRRASKAQKLFRQATPHGKEPRMWVVELGPGGFHGRDWSAWAMENFREYMALQYDVIEWAFGEDVGAVATFQPYGEKLWAQDHPHVHWVVNGYKPEDDKPKRVKRYNLADGGRDRILEDFSRRLAKASGARVPTDTLWVDIREPEAGPKRVLRYNMRELIDPTKWRYIRDQGILATESYATGREAARFDAVSIAPRVAAYGNMYAHWGAPGPRPVDKRFGCFSNRSMGDTAIIIGGDASHDDDCICGQCKQWGRPERGADLGHEGLMPRARWSWE